MQPELYETLYPQEEVLKLFRDVLRSSVPKEKRVYTSRMVCWLMVGQFLLQIGSLSKAVLETFSKGCEDLVGNCKRGRQGNWSNNTSALSQARKKLPIEHFENLLAKLHEVIRGKEPVWHDRRVYSIDGTTITLNPTEALRTKYRPSRNRYGQSAIPVVNVTVANDLLTGIAEKPEWDPMYGDNRQCELEQTLKIFDRLSKRAVIVSDRAHGVFFVVNKAVRCELDVVYRLTDQRAQSLLGVKKLTQDLDQPYQWKPSRGDLKAHPDLDSNCEINGRIIVRTLRHKTSLRTIAIFTTLKDISADDIVELYGRRWNIEGDIRDIKKTFKLDELTARTPEVLDREILAAIIGYNIVRSVILMTCLHHNIEDPRRVSFTNAWAVIANHVRELFYANSKVKCVDIVEHMMQQISFFINKKRNRKSYPRTVHKKRYAYPFKGLHIKAEELKKT